ncbi:hypothetical protein BDZ45DRAFT_310615 [Acephala macrosclerotiorum]|nr:hypothetical protein BDZ45DRAFT_310615 [Acephala macrosclerotiorum]
MVDRIVDAKLSEGSGASIFVFRGGMERGVVVVVFNDLSFCLLFTWSLLLLILGDNGNKSSVFKSWTEGPITISSQSTSCRILHNLHNSIFLITSHRPGSSRPGTSAEPCKARTNTTLRSSALTSPTFSTPAPTFATQNSCYQTVGV